MKFSSKPVAQFLTLRRTACRIAFLTLVAASGSSRAWSICTPPHSLSSQLKTQHDAAIEVEVGVWFADRHQYVCASDFFKKAAAADPASARDKYLLGLSLYSAGRPAEAVSPLRQSIARDPKRVNAYLTLGAALDQMGNRADAETQWRLALAVAPQSALALDNLSRDLLADGNYGSVIALLKPHADTGSLSVPLAVKLSVAYSKSGLLGDASAILHATLRANPSSIPVAEALAGVLILQMRVQEATEIVKVAAAQHPHNKEVQVLYLRTLVFANDTAQAEALSRALLASSPNNWEVQYLAGFLKLLEGDYRASQKYLQQSVALKPDNAECRFDLGVALAGMKANSAAKEQLQKAIDLGYSKPDVHIELARVLQALGDARASQEQLQLYRQSLSAQSAQTQAAGQAALADHAVAAGHLKQAVDFYRNALTTDPNEPLLAYKLAMALDKTGDIAGERTLLEHAIALNPRFALAQNQLGYIDSRQGDSRSAERHFRLAVEADPGYAKAWMNLAATLYLESEWRQSKVAVGHVLLLDPASIPAKQLSEQLDAMEKQQP